MGLFSPFTRVMGWREQKSGEFPQRRTHHTDDIREYQQPTPHFDPMYYLTYWSGNQLPGMFIHTLNPHEQWVAVKDRRTLYSASPYAAQRAAGSFNRNLSQQSSAEIVAQWRATWQAAAAANQRG